MKYVDGQEVRIGDKVELGISETGIVVCSIDNGEVTDEYLESQWEYLGKGVLINFMSSGLIHYTEPDEDLRLISRALNR